MTMASGAQDQRTVWPRGAHLRPLQVIIIIMNFIIIYFVIIIIIIINIIISIFLSLEVVDYCRLVLEEKAFEAAPGGNSL